MNNEIKLSDTWTHSDFYEKDLYALIENEISPFVYGMKTGEVAHLEKLFGPDKWNNYDDPVRKIFKYHAEQMIQRGKYPPLIAITLDYKNRLLCQKL